MKTFLVSMELRVWVLLDTSPNVLALKYIEGEGK